MKQLLLWQLRKTRYITLIALPSAFWFVLSFEESLTWHLFIVWLFCVVHSLAIAWTQGMIKQVDVGLIYNRGASRDQIWTAKMLASLISVMLVWLPIALLIWSRGRLIYQDYLLNPNALFIETHEQLFPLQTLLLYLFLLPVFNYAWIRTALNLQGNRNAWAIAVVPCLTLLWAIIEKQYIGLSAVIVVLVLALLTLTTSRILHRSIEVH